MKGLLIFLIVFLAIVAIVSIIVWYRRNSVIIQTGESTLGLLNIFRRK